MATAPPAGTAALQEETTRVLQRLIRFNTVNPPGDEREGQEWLAGYLGDAGFEVELLGATPERPNVVARLRGEADGPTLCLLSHMDTVYASPAEWSHDPWSGDLDDGFVWGRGALDMKSQTAAEAVGAAAVARAGGIEAGELLVVCVADEEAGGEWGAKWLTEEHPDKVRCDMLVNEGGGTHFDLDGRRYYGVCCAEKGVFRMLVSTDGVAGHASMPKMGSNALVKMAPLIEALGARQPSYQLTEAPAALLRAITGSEDPDPVAAVAWLEEQDPSLARLIEPTLGVTLTPTRISASEKVNVIPSRAELKVDGRVPPGLGQDEALAAAREVLGEGGYELEFTEAIVGNGSPIDSPLMDAIKAWVGDHDPEATVVPSVLPGFTDSRWFRQAFPDCDAYGFFPQRHTRLQDSSPLIHGADERIDVRDLGFAASFFAELPSRVLRV
jgi:acetylornithine deacetylase/succinyl-diaminopimelate desuccinylase-like protein